MGVTDLVLSLPYGHNKRNLGIPETSSSDQLPDHPEAEGFKLR
jgi:hypothetical protein